MTFKSLSVYLDKLEKTSSRIEITMILAELFKNSDSSEIGKTVYLLLGSLAPNYKSVVFNIAEKMMIEALAKAYSKQTDFIKSIYKKNGDLGEVALELSSQKKELGSKYGELSILDIYSKLENIAKDEGEGSQDRKIDNMAELLSGLDPLSSKFVARIPVGKLRLGFSDKTILDALSWMETGDKSKKYLLEKAYQVVPDVGLLAEKVKEVGINKSAENVKPVIGIPVLPMLAQRIKSPAEMIEKMGEVSVEPKFDGLRVLIHFRRQVDGDLIKAFTRNLNNIYEMFTELKDIGKYIDADEVILDSEAVGLDPETMRLADFQTTMQRRRKYDIEEKLKTVPLRFQVFDLIYKDGVSFMDTPYTKRREVLKNSIKKNTLLVVDENIITNNPEIIINEYKNKIKGGLEGIIIKKADSKYVPGRTGWRWVKMKEEETATGKLVDTVDCVVMGYYAGRGKRAQFGIGGFLVGVLDGEIVRSITKIGTGLSDEQFRELFLRLKKLEVREKPREYAEVNNILIPDIWVRPALVVEIAADEITRSPNHSVGLALRFPRLVKLRDDKSVSEATTVLEIKQLYKVQKG